MIIFLGASALYRGLRRRSDVHIHQHAHDGSDKVYAVLEDSVEVRIAGETRTLGEGEAALAAAGKEHGIANRSGAPAAVLVFLAPRPAH